MYKELQLIGVSHSKNLVTFVFVLEVEFIVWMRELVMYQRLVLYSSLETKRDNYPDSGQ